LLLPQLFQHIETVDFGHHVIKCKQIRSRDLQFSQNLRTIFGRLDRSASISQLLFQNIPLGELVVGNQNLVIHSVVLFV
jgi:hypothetical protein